jgi:hypothetical protein
MEPTIWMGVVMAFPFVLHAVAQVRLAWRAA